MHLLIVVPQQDRVTGNWITATRLRQGLTALGHVVDIAETAGDGDRLRTLLAATDPDCALLLHAWRSGRPWLASGATLPCAVLLTGTDINIGMADPQQEPVIAAVLARVGAILSQNELTVTALRRDRPELAGKLHYLPPGIVLGDTPFPLRAQLAASDRELVLLCPAGIRPVKGVLELIALCEPLVHAGLPLRLVFCGPLLDDLYGQRFLAAVAARPWANWLGNIAPEAMPAAMRQADVIVSNSANEGLPNALVEAAALGRPIVARAIPGNAAVVTDGCNGLLYADAAGFRGVIRQLFDAPVLRATLARPDPERFSPDREAAALEAVFRELLVNPIATCSRQL